MADFGAPVAAQVQGPNAGIQTLSNLLALKQQSIGIQRQQIGLSQAQQQLSQETSAATLAGLQATQQQNLSKINLRQYVDPKTGNVNLPALQNEVLQVAPNEGPAYLQRVEAMSQQGAQMHQAFWNLNQSEQAPIRAVLGTWAGDPSAKLSDLGSSLEQVEDTAPSSAQPQIRKMINGTLGLLSSPNLLTGNPKALAEAKAQALAFSRAGLSPSEASALATPRAGTIATGAQIIGTQTNPETGTITARGPLANQALPPTVIHNPITGAPAVVGGAGGTTPQPIGGGGPASNGAAWWQTGNWQPAPGTSQFVQAQVGALAHRINAGEAAANSAPTAIDALDRARAILDKGVATGTAFPQFKDMKNLVASMGVDTKGAQNASELAKNLARYEAARAGSVGDTDAARSLYEAGAPNTKMDAAAVKAVVLQSLGIERMIQGYAKVVGGAPNAHAALQAEQQFRSIPHLVQAYELGFMRNPAEANEFFKRYGISGKEIAKSYAELQKLGALP